MRNRLRDTAEKDRAESTATATAHDDRVDVALVGKLQDTFFRVAFDQQRLDVHEFLIVQSFARAREQALAHDRVDDAGDVPVVGKDGASLQRVARGRLIAERSATTRDQLVRELDLDRVARSL